MDRDIELAISRDDTLLKHHTDSWTSSQIDRHALRLALEAAWAENSRLTEQLEISAIELQKCIAQLDDLRGFAAVVRGHNQPTDYPKEADDGD